MDNIERLIIDMKEGLEREIHGLRTEMRERFHSVNTRVDHMSERLDRQGALLQPGSRWTNRTNQRAEKIDHADRVRKLEGDKEKIGV